MARAGLYIPAREPVELPWFGQVLADIGDEQSIEQSLSTFSGHIRRIGRILAALGSGEGWVGKEGEGDEGDEVDQGDKGDLEAAALTAAVAAADSLGDQEPSSPSPHLLIPPSPHPLIPPSPHLPTPTNALVLLDEVGAGTDPSEGTALAIALLKHLANRARLTMATTHYGELKALKYQDERFENASVEFDEATLSPTYRLLWGIPGRSNALAIARRLGLDGAVIDNAMALMATGAQDNVNQIIAGLEAQRRQQEDRSQAAAELLTATEKLHGEVQRKADLLRDREQELKLQQQAAVQQAIADAKRDIAKVIRRLQQGDATAQDAQRATAAVDAIAQSQLPAAAPAAKPGYRPAVGDRVRIPSLGQTAEVLTAPDNDHRITVRFGLMKTTVSLADIESLRGEKAEVPVKTKPVDTVPAAQAAPPAPAIRTSRNTIDLRGMRVAESEAVLEEAIAKGSGALWIIHGHGTGKLKAGVHEYLKRHPQIQRFEPAAQADGGTGGNGGLFVEGRGLFKVAPDL
jgi:DNA mismatch repair protein MutS2